VKFRASTEGVNRREHLRGYWVCAIRGVWIWHDHEGFVGRGRARMPRDDRAGTRITLPSSCSTTHEVRWHQLGALKDRLSYGVLNFFYLLKPRRTVADARRATSELVTAADVLHDVMRPTFPTMLAANPFALEALSAAGFPVTGRWDASRTLALCAEFEPWLRTRWRKQHATAGSNLSSSLLSLPSSWATCAAAGDTGCTNNVHLWKLASFLQSPFRRTLYLDQDVLVVWPPLAHGLLTETLNIADLASPLDVGRFFPPYSTSPIPPICGCFIAYSNAIAVHELFFGAASRLIGKAHRGVRQGDQEMIRLEWMSGHQSLRILMLPEEYYCPGLQYVQENATRAEWHTSWKGTLHVERGRYRCKAVHAHGFTPPHLQRLTGGRYHPRTIPSDPHK